MDNMRRVYQRAIAIPLNNVEHLWKEYDQWENALNRLTAKKFLAERSPAYMTARTALREMRIFTDAMVRGGVPKPPQWTDREMYQLDLWKRYIAWEKSNPLHLDDNVALADRVMYAYQQALLVLRFYPEIWYDFANYCTEMNKPEKAILILKNAMELPRALRVRGALRVAQVPERGAVSIRVAAGSADGADRADQPHVRGRGTGAAAAGSGGAGSGLDG
ncbi:hypothetical protein BC936DRAFT_142990 [Jimgerdemannia flammicorona]|uniref:Suppressor of forked domain-containing protein n=1 Tax=Jimgerdemannia flammicorona TaxID=994334 RepID=A0A432ZZL0_9FUNG|nr:hypothetical protein BC936DRAFT_142990 [Jimgerdemannia flammicorona]